MKSDPPNQDEIEVSLEDDTELELTAVEIDSEGFPLEFSVDGVIREVDSGILEDLQGNDLKPVAVRFQLLSTDE
ncbi:hypothetical protein CP556_24690 [Natrinema sp. CBA1119]|uniref:hypothetical protein n=1 Tax=Natrinema sp. CBA1119 TaxID=1608465 RepID=UPI000BF8C263|nr:hypothetical protein [Natrinema sp. CBA1119]PGF14210.1 hypothetical protein CP556_24690 [Natrinema sp. CBA1119]